LADTELEDLFEARRVIEKELAYLAALRASEEDLLTIAKTVEGMEKAIEARDKKEYAMMDMHFHESIAKASKNLVMCEIYYSIKNLVFRAVNKAGIINESLAFHKKIFEAIQQRRADEASELMLAHMKSVYAHLKDDGNK
jgi:GntR family transcriptional repressor for pyruvate dehydrogenase complex